MKSVNQDHDSLFLRTPWQRHAGVLFVAWALGWPEYVHSLMYWGSKPIVARCSWGTYWFFTAISYLKVLPMLYRAGRRIDIIILVVAGLASIAVFVSQQVMQAHFEWLYWISRFLIVNAMLWVLVSNFWDDDPPGLVNTLGQSEQGEH